MATRVYVCLLAFWIVEEHSKPLEQQENLVWQTVNRRGRCKDHERRFDLLVCSPHFPRFQFADSAEEGGCVTSSGGVKATKSKRISLSQKKTDVVHRNVTRASASSVTNP